MNFTIELNGTETRLEFSEESNHFIEKHLLTYRKIAGLLENNQDQLISISSGEEFLIGDEISVIGIWNRERDSIQIIKLIDETS